MVGGVCPILAKDTEGIVLPGAEAGAPRAATKKVGVHLGDLGRKELTDESHALLAAVDPSARRTEGAALLCRIGPLKEMDTPKRATAMAAKRIALVGDGVAYRIRPYVKPQKIIPDFFVSHLDNRPFC